jgi:putative aldouronate transport system substrate-binding protein
MNRLTRRAMLHLLGCGSAAAALGACAPKRATPGPTAAATPAAATVAPTAPPTAEPTEPPEPTLPPAAQPVVVTFVESWFGVPQYTDSIAPVTRAISEELQGEGINVELRSMILDDHEAKYPVLYASGADFTCAFDAPWYKMNSLIDQGFLLPLEGLLEQYGPKIVETTGPEIVEFNFMRGPDGQDHLYGIPARFYYTGTAGVVIRDDLREKYGVDAPTSMGGYPTLEPFLEAIKQNEPGMIPYANRPAYAMTEWNAWNRVGFDFGRRYGGFVINNVFEGTTIIDWEEAEWFQFAAALCRSWYEKGYLPKEAISTDYDTLTDYMATGKTACMIENEPDFKYAAHEKVVKRGIPEARLMGYDMTGMRDGLKGLGGLKQWNFVVFNAGAPAEQHTAAVQVWNWFTSSQENADLWLMGIEGVNWLARPNRRYADPEGVDSARNYRRQWYVSGITGAFQRLPEDLPAAAQEAIQFFTTKENFLFTPYEKFDVNTKEIETELAAMDAAAAEAYFGIATGSVPTDQAIATWKQMMDSAGRQKVKDFFQRHLDAWLEENAEYVESFETGYTGQPLATWPR